MMAAVDDSDEFEQAKRQWARELSSDSDLARRAIDTTVAADRHHYSYLWSWLGLPLIQMPEDIVVMQEIIWETKPQVIVETGIARGGSVIFFSSLLELLGDGKVVAIDIDLRPHNRKAIEENPLSKRVRMIEGSSTDDEVLSQVKDEVKDLDRVMVVLDSNHTHDHVLRELHLYAPLVTLGQYLIVHDTIVEEIPPQTHRPRPWGPGNNPKTALIEYLKSDDSFQLDPFVNEKVLITSSPRGYLRRVR